MSAKYKVIFVGAFANKANDGTVGGQLYACRSLLKSAATACVDWILIDGTARSQPPPPLWVRAWYVVWRMLHFGREILLTNPDTVFVFSAFTFLPLCEKAFYCWTGKLLGKRVVLSIRSEVCWRQRPGLRWVAKQVLSACDAVICQSERAKRSLTQESLVEADKISVIPNWINLSRYPVKRYVSAENRENATGTVKLLYLGWLEKFKGLYVLLEAVKILLSRGLDVDLILCGDGSERARLEAYCRRNGIISRVSFRGWIYGADKHQALLASDVLVHPSFSEGLPNAVLEGMASGLPVVATAVGGVPETIQDGVDGILVPPKNVQAFVDALDLLVRNYKLRCQIGLAARATLEKDHELETAASQVISILMNRVADAVPMDSGLVSR